jgi:hypothetical protein
MIEVGTGVRKKIKEDRRTMGSHQRGRCVRVLCLAGMVMMALAVTGCKTMESVGGIGDGIFTKGGIAVETRPSGADIYINEKYVGRSPVKEPLEPGLYRVEARKRRIGTVSEWVEVPKGKMVRTTLDIEGKAEKGD